MTTDHRRAGWWWVATLILVPVVLGSVLSVALLLALVEPVDVRDRIELIKTGLAIGAGTGGAVALVLAGRRQWSLERAHRVTERSAEDVRHDAGERRITDLYSKAADQLGSDKAAVRLAGLYSLERLAQDTPPLRQTIVNLLCAYLRMPFHTDVDEDVRQQEIEVRRTVERIFSAHLQPGDDPHGPVPTFWPDIDLDLSGAVLHVLDLRQAEVRQALFGGARFLGWVRFTGTRFTGDAIFGGTGFETSASFRSVRFGAEARFRGAEFRGATTFLGATFEGEALFGGVRGPADSPDGAVFVEGATFTGAEFAQPPILEHVRASAPIVDLPGWDEPA